MSQTMVFLQKRKDETRKNLRLEIKDTFDSAYNLIEKYMCVGCDEVTPEFTRKLEILESILFGFFDHCLNPALLESAEEEIGNYMMGKYEE